MSESETLSEDSLIHVQKFSFHQALSEDPKVPIGYGSGLTYIESDPSSECHRFLMVSDRGPNGKGPYIRDKHKALSEGTVFLTPNFVPRFCEIEVCLKSKELRLIREVRVSNSSGEEESGLVPSFIHSEISLTHNLSPIPGSDRGIDLEGIAQDKDGNIWAVDEYGPSILQIDGATGKILNHFSPRHTPEIFPELLTLRQPNRGFEGAMVDDKGNVYAALQSVLDLPGAKKQRFILLVCFTPADKRVELFLIPHEVTREIEEVKIGDLEWVGEGKFIFIQQESVPGKGKVKTSLKVGDLNEATDIAPLAKSANDLWTLLTAKNLSKIESEGSNTRAIAVENLLDLSLIGWDAEKTEGLALLPDKRTVVIADDNDFGVSSEVILKPRDFISDSGRFEITDPVKARNFRYKVNSKAENSLWFIEFPRKF
jgi:hypothetical protein